MMKNIIKELNLTKELLKDKGIQDFLLQVAYRKHTGEWVQFINGNGFCELNKNNGTMITTVLNDNEEFEPEFPLNMDCNISNRCQNACTFCLPNGELISTSNGYKEIEKIREGDIVNSFNIENKEEELKRVTHLFKRYYNGELIEIKTINGKTLKLTPNHKVYTQRGYIRADELLLTDELILQEDYDKKENKEMSNLWN